jgi:hypothetical protein
VRAVQAAQALVGARRGAEVGAGHGRTRRQRGAQRGEQRGRRVRAGEAQAGAAADGGHHGGVLGAIAAHRRDGQARGQRRPAAAGGRPRAARLEPHARDDLAAGVVHLVLRAAPLHLQVRQQAAALDQRAERVAQRARRQLAPEVRRARRACELVRPPGTHEPQAGAAVAGRAQQQRVVLGQPAVGRVEDHEALGWRVGQPARQQRRQTAEERLGVRGRLEQVDGLVARPAGGHGDDSRLRSYEPVEDVIRGLLVRGATHLARLGILGRKPRPRNARGPHAAFTRGAGGAGRAGRRAADRRRRRAPRPRRGAPSGGGDGLQASCPGRT